MRVLVVSNRLPFTASSENGELVLQPSSGGLVSGLSAYLNWAQQSQARTDYLWIGWPGVSVDDKTREKLKSKASKLQASPVFIDDQTMDKFYHGFCNSTIWPLF